MTVLSREELRAALAGTPPLIEDADLHLQLQANGVDLRVEAEDMLTGNVVHVASAYLVFVATDERGKPVPLPPLVAETDDERRRMKAAETRRSLRLHRPRTA